MDIKFNIKSAFPEMHRLFKKYKERVNNLLPVNQEILSYLHFVVEQIFKAEGAYGGRPSWLPISSGWIKYKVSQGGRPEILQFTQLLINSLTGNNSHSISEATNTYVAFGTTVPYAGSHHRGENGMLRRRLFYWTASDLKYVKELVKHYLLTGDVQSLR